MKLTSLITFSCIAVLIAGCAAGISRTGYQLPKNTKSKDLERRPVAIQCNVKYNPNEVDVVGSIHAYDTGFSTDCDEAYVLDTFLREATYVQADLVNITEEKQPTVFGSTCYRAKAQFLRFKDREKVRSLVSDPQFAPELVIERTAKFSKRQRAVIIGAVAGGLVGAIVVGVVVSPNDHTNMIPNKATMKH